MSAFDDEFGLFGEDADDAERRSTLGARKIATGARPSSMRSSPKTIVRVVNLATAPRAAAANVRTRRVANARQMPIPGRAIVARRTS